MKYALVLLLALAACAPKEAPPPARVEAPPQPAAAPKPKAPVETDRTHYVMQQGQYGPETTIVTRFTAPADREVYVTNCNDAIGMGLQRLEGSEWKSAYVTPMNACMSAPIVMKAGETREKPMTVIANMGPKLESGTYRVVWYGVLTEFAKPPWPELPIEQRASAPITIDEGPPAVGAAGPGPR